MGVGRLVVRRRWVEAEHAPQRDVDSEQLLPWQGPSARLAHGRLTHPPWGAACPVPVSTARSLGLVSRLCGKFRIGHCQAIGVTKINYAVAVTLQLSSTSALLRVRVVGEFSTSQHPMPQAPGRILRGKKKTKQ